MNLAILIGSISAAFCSQVEPTNRICENGSSEIPISTIIALIGLVVSIVSVFLSNRFQLLGSINSKLSELAKECDRDIEFEQEKTTEGKINEASYAIKETFQHISHTVSTIISAKQLLKGQIRRNLFFFLFLERQACVDKFYIQLQASIKDFIMDEAKNRHESFANKNIDKNIDHLYHLMEQIKECNKWLRESNKRYGNATPPEMKNRIDDFKELRFNEKMKVLKILIASNK